MKRKIFYVMLFTIICLVPRVDAATARKTCNQIELKNYKEIATNMTANYELVANMETYDDYDKIPMGGTAQDYYYRIIIDNVTEEFYIKVGAHKFLYKDSKDGKLVADYMYHGGANVNVGIYVAGNGDCKDTLVRNIAVKLPYYNVYSVFPECEGKVGILKICSPDIDTSKINEESFKKMVKEQEEEYNKENAPEEKEEVKEEKWYKKIINWYNDNKKLTIPATVAVIVLIVLIVIKVKRDNKNKIKVDLGDI